MPDVTWADRKTTFENFDPNARFAGKPLWGVFDGARFKTYAQRGHAINSRQHHHRWKLYEQTSGGWILRATQDNQNKPQVCGHCGGSTMDYATHRRFDYSTKTYVTTTDSSATNQGSYVFRRRGRKLVEPIELLFCCKECAPVVSP